VPLQLDAGAVGHKADLADVAEEVQGALALGDASRAAAAWEEGGRGEGDGDGTSVSTGLRCGISSLPIEGGALADTPRPRRVPPLLVVRGAPRTPTAAVPDAATGAGDTRPESPLRRTGPLCVPLGSVGTGLGDLGGVGAVVAEERGGRRWEE
jgi:hypothetical protein